MQPSLQSGISIKSHLFKSILTLPTSSNMNLFSLSPLTFLHISYKRNHTMCSLLWLASFTSYNVSKAHPCCSIIEGSKDLRADQGRKKMTRRDSTAQQALLGGTWELKRGVIPCRVRPPRGYGSEATLQKGGKQGNSWQMAESERGLPCPGEITPQCGGCPWVCEKGSILGSLWPSHVSSTAGRCRVRLSGECKAGKL